jgi:hypothetical protein
MVGVYVESQTGTALTERGVRGALGPLDSKRELVEAITIRLGAEQLRTLLEGWQHPEIALRLVPPEETEAAADLILEASREIRTLTDAGIRGTRASCAATVSSGNAFLFVEHQGVPAGVLRGELYPAAEGRREAGVAREPWSGWNGLARPRSCRSSVILHS